MITMVEKRYVTLLTIVEVEGIEYLCLEGIGPHLGLPIRHPQLQDVVVQFLQSDLVIRGCRTEHS